MSIASISMIVIIRLSSNDALSVRGSRCDTQDTHTIMLIYPTSVRGIIHIIQAPMAAMLSLMHHGVLFVVEDTLTVSHSIRNKHDILFST